MSVGGRQEESSVASWLGSAAWNNMNRLAENDLLKGNLSHRFATDRLFFFQIWFSTLSMWGNLEKPRTFFHQAPKTGQWSSVLKGSLLENKRLIPNVTSTERRRGKQEKKTWTSETSSDPFWCRSLRWYESLKFYKLEVACCLFVPFTGNISKTALGCRVWRRTAVPTKAHLKLPYGVLPEMAWYHILSNIIKHFKHGCIQSTIM